MRSVSDTLCNVANDCHFLNCSLDDKQIDDCFSIKEHNSANLCPRDISCMCVNTQTKSGMVLLLMSTIKDSQSCLNY